MPNRKIRVGVANESLTPEEEHKIEVKLDKMLALPGTPQADSLPAESKVTVRSEESKGESITVTTKDSKRSVPEPTSAPEVPAGALAGPVPQLVKVPWREKVTPPEEPVSEGVSGAEQASDEETIAPEGEVTISNLDAIPESPATSGPKQGPSVTIPSREDDILAVQDAEIAKAFENDKKPKQGNRFKQFFASWWKNKKLRFGTLAGIVIVLLVLFILPVTRAMALNLFGIRASADVVVLDATTQLPLQGASVTVGSASGTSDAHGNLNLHGVKLGSQQMTIQKVAFVTTTKTVKVSTGSNSLGPVALKADGSQYKFTLSDYVTGKPIVSGRVSSGESSALSDSKGLVILTLKTPQSKFTANVSAIGYRPESMTVEVGKSETTAVQLVTTVEDVYVSKQSGKYDVLKADIDGKNQKVLLAGTGNENAQLSLAVDVVGDEAALISTRDNQKDADGYLLQTLSLVNVNTGASTAIDHSERIQIVDWIGDRLVYVEAKAGASAANPSRYQLYSYDYKNSQRLLLDHANYFNDIVSAGGAIYYATSNQYSGGISQFNKINADNTGKQTLLVNEIWNIFRTGYGTFSLASAAGWYDYKLGDAKPTTTDTKYNGAGRLYINSPDTKHSLWVDQRDGKGALLSYDSSTQKDTVITEQSGLVYPVRWITNDTVVYRIKTSKETADYVINLAGGAPKKIVDVTNANGINFFQAD